MNLYELARRAYGTFLYYYRRIFLYPRASIPFKDEANYDEYWAKRRKNGAGKVTSWQKERATLAARIIRARGGNDLVLADIGGGDAAATTYVKTLVPGVSTIVSYDGSPAILEAARENGAETVLMDLRASDFADKIEPCDYAFLFEVIEHVANAEELTAAALAKARRGVFISVPNTGYFPYRLRLLLGSAPMQWVQYPNEHLRFWTMRDMRWWLNALGLKGQARLVGYKGVPFLNTIWPALFAAGLFVWIERPSTV